MVTYYYLNYYYYYYYTFQIPIRQLSLILSMYRRHSDSQTATTVSYGCWVSAGGTLGAGDICPLPPQ